jgi:hypothetical protein
LYKHSAEEYTTGTESQQAEKKTNKTTTTWRNYRSDYPPKFSSKNVYMSGVISANHSSNRNIIVIISPVVY